MRCLRDAMDEFSKFRGRYSTLLFCELNFIIEKKHEFWHNIFPDLYLYYLIRSNFRDFVLKF